MRLAITLYFLFIFSNSIQGQFNRINQGIQKQNLLAFANKKQSLFNQQQKLVKSFSKRYHIQLADTSKTNGIIILNHIDNGHPSFLKTHNINAAISSGIDLLWPNSNLSFNLDGSNIEVGVWDGGSIYQQHQEFLYHNNIWQRDKPAFELNHSTHVAGTISAEGINVNSKGAAPASKIAAYDFSNDVTEMAVAAAEGLQASNHSYGAVCGWNYNNNTETWYWHGNKAYNPIEDVRFGMYDSTSWAIDFICYNAPNYLPVKSAGNDRNEGPDNQPTLHFDWNDGWFESHDIHDLDGSNSGFCCITPKAAAKNNLVIGSIKDLPDGYTSADNVQLETYSAFGPCKDGRIKPDLVANGEYLLSCINDSIDAYSSYSGTSMAAASATGAIALLLQYQEQLSPGVKLLSSSIKALLINTANECGNTPGPDYKYGWGLINTYRAALALKQNNSSGGACIIENLIKQEELQNIPISVAENTEQLKLTLCWTDPPGSVDEPTQTNTTTALTNNIDVTVINIQTNETYYPWVLNPNTPNAAAIKGINKVDNVEQIVIDNPIPGDYTIAISSTNNNSIGQQTYSLVVDGHITDSNLYPPTNLSYRMGDKTAYLFWYPPATQPLHYNIYCNNQLLVSTVDTCIIITNLQNDVEHLFYVKSEYTVNKESQSSNSINITPMEARKPPITYNFESGLEGWNINERMDGWRLGTKDSLTSYYLNFEDNTGHFLWIDSGINTWHSHVTDIASSPPLSLIGLTDIKVNFDYVFVTNIYDVIDELHVVYRQVGDDEWNKVQQPKASSSWQRTSITLPADAAETNTQIGFYYDDFYLHGMGAAIDNIEITGTTNTSVSNNDSDFFIIRNNQELKVYYSIDNQSTCIWSLYDLTGRIISVGNEQLINGQVTIKLSTYHSGLYLLRCKVGNHNLSEKIILN